MKRMISALLLLGILVVGLVADTSGVTAAPPEHNKHYDTFELVCDDGPYTVVSIAHSQTGAFHSVDGGDVFILVSFEVVDTEGQVITIPIGQGKRVGQQGDWITCETPELDAVTATFLRVPR